MPQQDKIKREIDRIGLALAKLLAGLLNKDVPYSTTIDTVSKQLLTELDIDLDALFALNDGDAMEFLVNSRKYSIEHLRSLANLLYELADRSADGQTRQKLLHTALNVYEYISTNNKGTLFLDVEYRLKELQGTTQPRNDPDQGPAT